MTAQKRQQYPQETSTSQLLFSSFKRILACLEPQQRRRVWSLFGWMVLLALAELSSILLLTFFFAATNNPEAVKNYWFVQKFLGLSPAILSFSVDSRKFLLLISTFPITAVIFKNILSYIVYKKMTVLGEEVSAYVGTTMMTHFLYMPYQWHLSSASADMFQKVSWRYSLGQMLVSCLVIYSNLLTTTLLFCALIINSPGVTLLVIAVMAGAGTVTYISLRESVSNNAILNDRMQGRESRAVLAAIKGIREVLIYRQQKAFIKAIEAPVRQSVAAKAFLAIAPPLPTWVLEACGFGLIGFTLAMLIYVSDAPLPTITATVALLALTAWRVLPSLNKAVSYIVNLRGHAPMGWPCLLLFEDIKRQKKEYDCPPTPGFTIDSAIELQDVSFRYEGSDVNSLTNITLSIAKETTIGIVGKSGAGKSTLINILSGLLAPTEGELHVDGANLAGGDLSAYRAKVGYVPQTPFLMPGTVAENIAFSAWGQPYDEARIREVCTEAAIEFLGADHADIYKAIGEGGAGFSGGQAQRISIARALYPGPSVLILDEATSSLDQGSEAAIQKSVLALKGKVTCIIAAHRLSTLRICDSVIWLESGRLVTHGPATDILPQYSAMLNAGDLP